MLLCNTFHGVHGVYCLLDHEDWHGDCLYHVICVVVPGVARYIDLSSQDVVLHAAYLGQGVGDDGLGVVGCEPLCGLWNSNTCYIRFCARTRTTTTPRNGVSRRK